MMVKRNCVRFGWLKAAAGVLALAFSILALAGCAQAATPEPPTATVQVQPSATQLPPTATELPSATPTLPPTATQKPSATPTQPPTETPVPPLAVLDNGFSAWCAPQTYAGVNPTGPEAPQDANQAQLMGEVMQVKIPAAYCVMDYRFNQLAPAGSTLVFYDGNSAFLKLPLKPVDGRPNEGWTAVSHDYVVNPPLWEITYRLAVLGPDGKELWTQPVKFAKPLPEPCKYGGLPDPVTFYCAIADPKEIEPHPDITWPPYYTRVP